MNEIVTGPTDASNHLAVLVSAGNIKEGAGCPLLLDMRDKAHRPLYGHCGVVTDALFTSDGRYIMTGSDDQSVCVYDAQKGAMSCRIRTPSAITRMTQHKRHPICAVASAKCRNSIMIVNTELLVHEATSIPFLNTVLDFAFGAADTSVSEDLVVGYQEQSFIYRYQLTPSGLKVADVKEDEGSGFLVRSIPTTAAAHSSCFFYASERGDIAGSDKIKIWDVRDRDITTVTIRSHTGRGRHMIGDMSVSPDGRFLQTSGTDSCVCISDLRRLGSKPLLVLKHQYDFGQPSEGVATEWSPDSRFLVTGADDCAVRIWDMFPGGGSSDDDAAAACLIRTIDGNANGEGCIHIVAALSERSGFVYGTKLGYVVAFEQ